MPPTTRKIGSGGSASRQLVFDLTRDPSFDPDDYLVAPCNEAAHTTVLAWPGWSDRVLLLIGPPGSGKSHLAAIWASASGARKLTGTGCLDAKSWPEGSCAATLEDCDRLDLDETALFHLLNVVRATGGWLLLTARLPPDRWALATPDLLSRLRLAPTVSIDRPDTALMKAVLVKLFVERQIAIDEDVVTYAARHCEQSLEAVNTFVAAVDEVALSHGRRITRRLAATTLGRVDDEADPLGSSTDRPYGPT